jgi:hypothetical protein
MPSSRSSSSDDTNPASFRPWANAEYLAQPRLKLRRRVPACRARCETPRRRGPAARRGCSHAGTPPPDRTVAASNRSASITTGRTSGTSTTWCPGPPRATTSSRCWPTRSNRRSSCGATRTATPIYSPRSRCDEAPGHFWSALLRPWPPGRLTPHHCGREPMSARRRRADTTAVANAAAARATMRTTTHIGVPLVAAAGATSAVSVVADGDADGAG